jgi:hypothetical protein
VNYILFTADNKDSEKKEVKKESDTNENAKDKDQNM